MTAAEFAENVGLVVGTCVGTFAIGMFIIVGLEISKERRAKRTKGATKLMPRRGPKEAQS